MWSMVVFCFHTNKKELMSLGIKTLCLFDCWFSLKWSTAMFFNENKRKRLHNNRVQFPEDLVGAPTWPPFLSGCDVLWFENGEHGWHRFLNNETLVRFLDLVSNMGWLNFLSYVNTKLLGTVKQVVRLSALRSRNGTVVRAFASNRCDRILIPRLGTAFGLSLLVLWNYWTKMATNMVSNTLKPHTNANTVRGRPTLRNGSVGELYDRSLYEQTFISEHNENHWHQSLTWIINIFKFSTSDIAFLAFWLVQSISVISSYTVWPNMELIESRECLWEVKFSGTKYLPR